MASMPKEGDVFDGRWKIVRLLSSGYAGSVFQAIDLRTQEDYAIKVFPKRDDAPFRQYTDHLLSIRASLSGFSTEGLSLPIEEGETEDNIYQVYELIRKVQSLRNLIQDRAPMRPEEALSLLAKVAEPLVALEKGSVIHGDLKPENILVQGDSGEKVFLIDFGMAQTVEAENSLLLMGTPRYLHPELRPLLTRHSKGSLNRREALRLFGPHLDVYALGVTALEMLTGQPDLPRPLTADAMSLLLRHLNPCLAYVGQELLHRLSELLVRMVGVDPSLSADAREVSAECRDLLGMFQQVSAPQTETKDTARPSRPATVASGQGVSGGLGDAIESLRSIAESLETATTLMLQSMRRLEPISMGDRDVEMLREMNVAFENAVSRIKASWRIGTGISVVCFLLIAGMIICSIVLALTTGKSGWGLVFGGASVPLVIGTLLWRPYDRAFKATILAQQLEMIHVQSTAAFRGTTDLEKRIEICREAVAGLQNLLDQHSTEGSGHSQENTDPKKAPTTPSNRRRGRRG